MRIFHSCPKSSEASQRGAVSLRIMFQKPLEGQLKVPFASGTQRYVIPVTKQLALLGCPGLIILACGGEQICWKKQETLNALFVKGKILV